MDGFQAPLLGSQMAMCFMHLFTSSFFHVYLSVQIPLFIETPVPLDEGNLSGIALT